MTQRHVCLLLASPPNNRGQSAGSPTAGHSCSWTVLLGDSVSVLVHTYGRPASASRVSRCWVCSDCTLEVVSCFISSKYWRSFFTTRSFLYTVDVCRHTRTHACTRSWVITAVSAAAHTAALLLNDSWVGFFKTCQ